jgi:hypothetical protein
MTPLSPAAQAQKVLDAANGASSYGPDDCLNESRQIAAAAIRAAVDQVAPEPRAFISPGTASQIRSQFLAIAAELDGITANQQG